jgi:hypothetical protein
LNGIHRKAFTEVLEFCQTVLFADASKHNAFGQMVTIMREGILGKNLRKKVT